MRAVGAPDPEFEFFITKNRTLYPKRHATYRLYAQKIALYSHTGLARARTNPWRITHKRTTFCKVMLTIIF